MSTISSISITGHTTASAPRVHIVYTVSVKKADGESYDVPKRYSEFVALHNTLADPFALPPKRILTTAFVPSAWADDALLEERKTGLEIYMTSLLASSQFNKAPAFVAFFSKPAAGSTPVVSSNLEDALPSTLSRKTALQLVQGLASGEGEGEGEVKAAASSLIAASYYPDWAVDTNPPEDIDFTKFDILFFAFATPSSSNGIAWDSGATSTLKRLVSAANSSGAGTKVVLSIGGWGGCQFYSQAMSSSANRTTFVNACVSAVNTYGLAGIDIDWEFPNESGAGQPFSSADSANLLSFFKSLRTALGTSKIISSAVTPLPWLGSNGSPLTDVSAYAAQMTYVNIMNYDTWGASSTPGPNAPLGNLCGTSQLPQYSAEAAFAQWTKAGFPADKLLLGMPTYGYVSQSTKTTLVDIALPPPGFPPSVHQERVLACRLPAGAKGKKAKKDKEAEEVHGDVEEVPAQPPNAIKGRNARPNARPRARAGEVDAAAAGDLSAWLNQQIPFNQIVALGALTKSGGVYVQANGYTEGWDDCSDTPFLFDTARKTVVTYDDTFSLSDKAAYAKSSGMAGCFTWSLDQDDGYALQDAIRSALGK